MPVTRGEIRKALETAIDGCVYKTIAEDPQSEDLHAAAETAMNEILRGLEGEWLL
jgi:hypothetical protein